MNIPEPEISMNNRYRKASRSKEIMLRFSKYSAGSCMLASTLSLTSFMAANVLQVVMIISFIASTVVEATSNFCWVAINFQFLVFWRLARIDMPIRDQTIST